MNDENNMRDQQNEPYEYGSYPKKDPTPSSQYREPNQYQEPNQYREPNQYQEPNQYREPNQYQEPYQYYEPERTSNEGNGKAVAGLVLGIISIVFCWMPIVSWISGIIALILSISYRKSNASEARGLATGGMICAIIGLVISVIVFIAVFTLTMAMIPMIMDGMY